MWFWPAKVLKKWLFLMQTVSQIESSFQGLCRQVIQENVCSRSYWFAFNCLQVLMYATVAMHVSIYSSRQDSDVVLFLHAPEQYECVLLPLLLLLSLQIASGCLQAAVNAVAKMHCSQVLNWYIACPGVQCCTAETAANWSTTGCETDDAQRGRLCHEHRAFP